MADGICSVISSSVARDCVNKPLPNIAQKVLLIPSTLLPKSGITFTDNLITAIALASGLGVLIEGVQNKNTLNHSNSFTNPTDGTPGFIHMLQGIKILDPSVETRLEIEKLMTGGGSYFAIVERLWKGTASEDAFQFYGFDSGLHVPDGGLIDNSNENEGTMMLTLQTPEGFKETGMPKIFLDTDYPTTAASVWTDKLAA